MIYNPSLSRSSSFNIIDLTNLQAKEISQDDLSIIGALYYLSFFVLFLIFKGGIEVQLSVLESTFKDRY